LELLRQILPGGTEGSHEKLLNIQSMGRDLSMAFLSREV
jgi:hypothetical protein